MVENQHKLIKGYNDLAQERIDLINEIKRHEDETAKFWQAIRVKLRAMDAPLGEPYPTMKSTEGGRQLALARTSLEAGFSHMVRAVAAPDSPWV
jgi:hypothetical protein